MSDHDWLVTEVRFTPWGLPSPDHPPAPDRNDPERRGEAPPDHGPRPEPHCRTKDTLSVKEAAEDLGVGEDAVRIAIGKGQLPSIRLGRKIRIPAYAVRRLLYGEDAR